MHEASVPVFARYLGRLALLIEAAQRHTHLHGLSDSTLLDARLAPDMLPFSAQAEIAANFALRACFPLVGHAVPPYGEFPASFDGLRQRIDHVLRLLTTLTPEAFDGDPAGMITADAGQATLSLPAHEFLFQFALPNFFFHLTTAYAILRQQGVPIGKANFDGFHAYGQRATAPA